MQQLFYMVVTMTLAVPLFMVFKRVNKLARDVHEPILSILAKIETLTSRISDLTLSIENPVQNSVEAMKEITSTIKELNVLFADLEAPVKTTGEKIVAFVDELNRVATAMQGPVEKLEALLDKANNIAKEIQSLTTKLEGPVQESGERAAQLINELKNVAQSLHNVCDTIELVSVRKTINNIATTTEKAICCWRHPKVKEPSTASNTASA